MHFLKVHPKFFSFYRFCQFIVFDLSSPPFSFAFKVKVVLEWNTREILFNLRTISHNKPNILNIQLMFLKQMVQMHITFYMRV